MDPPAASHPRRPSSVRGGGRGGPRLSRGRAAWRSPCSTNPSIDRRRRAREHRPMPACRSAVYAVVALLVGCGPPKGDATETGDDSPEPCSCRPDDCYYGSVSKCPPEPLFCEARSLFGALGECSVLEGPCAGVTEACKPGHDCVTESDPSSRTYSEEGLECALLQLRDRTPGTLIWSAEANVHFAQRHVLYLLDDGRAFVHGCYSQDFGAGYDAPSEAVLASPSYFDGCLAEVEAYARWECMVGGIFEGASLPICG